MAVYKIRGRLIVDFEELEVEADSEDEALNELYRMGSEEIIKKGLIIDSDIEGEYAECLEADCVVRVNGIDYSIEYYDIADQVEERFPEVETGTQEFDDLVDKEIAMLKERLPKTLEVTLFGINPEDIEDYLADYISDETGWLINGYESYEILEVK